MEMTNQELVTNHNRLFAIQDAEKTYYKTHKEQFFKGRIKITYAIKKNIAELKEKLQPYDESYQELRKEYFDVEAEDEDLKQRQKEYQKAGDGVKVRPQRKEILLEGKDRDEFEKKLEELLSIKVKDVSIRTITLDMLDDIPLSSGDLDALAFMIEDF